MTRTREKAEAAAELIRRHCPLEPRFGVILGTGLGGWTEELAVAAQFDYETVPHFVPATAPTHRGALVLGEFSGTGVAAMSGRFHGYEGYSPAQIAFPVYVMAALGATTLLVSNACGGMNPHYRAGELMIVTDHVNLSWGSPLVGSQGASGPHYVDMSCPYDPQLIQAGAAIARRGNFVAHQGVYVGVLGPNYETRAEYRLFRRLGGDAVGMSTVHEVIAARHCGMRVFAVSVVTNECRPDALGGTVSSEVEHVASGAETKVRALLGGLVTGASAAASAGQSILR